MNRLRTAIRAWLGITELKSQLLRLERQQEQITIPLNAIATILLSEHSSARQELSNRLNAETAKRFQGEVEARAVYNNVGDA